MCVNYLTVSRAMLNDMFQVPVSADLTWPDEVYQDYSAPIIRASQAGGREALLASYGMVPKQHIPAGVKRFSTMNARAETVAQLRSFASAWRQGQRCLVPMRAFFEPNWETGRAVRWSIGMADSAPFAVAGLYRSWRAPDDSASFSFTQLTINADAHPVMQRFHRPGAEKRSLVILPSSAYEAWLDGADEAQARALLRLPAPEWLTAAPAPSAPSVKRLAAGQSLSLF